MNRISLFALIWIIFLSAETYVSPPFFRDYLIQTKTAYRFWSNQQAAVKQFYSFYRLLKNHFFHNLNPADASLKQFRMGLSRF